MLIKLIYLFSILLAFDAELSAQNPVTNTWSDQRTSVFTT